MKIGYLMQEGGPDIRKVPRSGPANHVFKVFEGLTERGHNVRLLARWDNIIWRSDDLVTFERVAVQGFDRGPRRQVERLVRGVQSRIGVPYLNLFESLRYAAACRQELGDRDVYYERMGWMGYGAGIAARRSGIPLVLEVNNGDFVTELEMLEVAPSGFQKQLALKLMSAAVTRSRFVVATGEGHRERFISFWKVDPAKVTTIENGTDLVGLLNCAELSAFKPAENGAKDVTIAFVGAFEPWHGTLKLLEAVRRVVATKPNVRLRLIGSGTLWNQIRDFIREHGLTDVVEMTGQLDIRAVAGELSRADIGAAPYCGWMEFSGLKLFDYKAAGLAIVASGENGRPQTLTDGQTALIVPPCREDLLADAIMRLVDDQPLRRTMGQNARREAEERHTWQHTAREIEGVLEMVTHGR